MTAKLWDTETGMETQTFSGHTGHILAVALSLDGNEIVTGSTDRTARLWCQGKVAILVHNGAVNYVAFSPDGTKVLTASEDGTARIWDLHDLSQTCAATPIEGTTTVSPPNLDKHMHGYINASQIALSQLLALLSADTGVRFALDEGITPKIAISLESPTVQEVLDSVLPGQGLDYLVTPEGVVRIGTISTIKALKTAIK